MMERERKNRIINHLKTERRQLVERRRTLEESQANLGQDQVEFEERAANQQMTSGLEQLDGEGEKKIAAINHALERLEDDEYEFCESCGERILPKRLEVLPWTSLCIDCAENEEQAGAEAAPAEEPEGGTDTSEELQGLSDDQRIQAVTDAVVRDATVPLDDLRVECKDGRLSLRGALPDKRQLSRLRQIVYDVLGFTDVEEEIRLDRTAWARKDRTPGIRKENDGQADIADGSGVRTIEAVKEGKSMDPADELIPEQKKR